MSLTKMKDDYRKLALDAHSVVTDENLTPAERRERYEKMDADLQALSEQIQNAEFLDEQRTKLQGIIGAGSKDAEQETKAEKRERSEPHGSYADVLDLEMFNQARQRFQTDGRINTGPMEVKNATLTTGGLSGDLDSVVAPDRRPGIIPILFQRLTVADLMPNFTVGTPTWRSVVETVATNAASTVAEGGTKPDADFDVDVVDEPIRKIAVIKKVSDEALEDIDWMRGYLNGRLSLFVRIREEQQLLSGAGTGVDIDGLLNRDLTAAQAQGADTIAVAVHKEITKVRVASFLDPDAIVWHPNDWQAARLEQDANDQFYGGGPFTGQYGNGGIAGNTYWGLQTVVTTAMTENTVLLGAFSLAAAVLRRKGLTVDMTNSDQDDFIKNLVTLRAEERVGLEVTRPSAFGTVTGVG